MKLEQQLLINREWSKSGNYWSMGDEVITTPIDQQGMKLEQTTTDQHGMKFEQKLLINREWS